MATTRTIASGGTGAGTATLKAAVTIIRDGNELVYDLPALYFSVSPAQIRSVDLAAGSNTITLDNDARGVVVCPRAGNATPYTVRISGDTGLAENVLGMAFRTFNAALASFEIFAGALGGAGTAIADVTIIEL